QFLRRLALVAPVAGQDLEDEGPLEFAYRFIVGDTPRVHLGNQVVQLAFQSEPLSRIPVRAGPIDQRLAPANYAAGLIHSGCAFLRTVTPLRIRSPSSAGATTAAACAIDKNCGAKRD